MAQVKGTPSPGEWRFDPRGTTIHAEGGRLVCDMPGPLDSDPGMWDYHTEADAALILASKDLLNALERIMHYASIGAAASDVDTNEQPEFVAARAAITKARTSPIE